MLTFHIILDAKKMTNLVCLSAVFYFENPQKKHEMFDLEALPS